MSVDRHASSWHEAVERAGFDIYEPDTDRYRWAGGYNSLCTHIGVCGLVGEHTTRVETWANAAGIDDEALAEVSTIQLEMRHRAENGGEPPEDAADVVPDDRLVTVDDATYRCAGRRLVGLSSVWAGHITIAGVRVQISTTSRADEIAVRVCTDAHALIRTPPPGRWRT